MKVRSAKPPPVVEEVDSAVDSQFVSDVEEAQRAVAELEFRIHNLDKLVEEEVTRRVETFAANMNAYLARAEMEIFSRLVEFFQQCPGWEIKKVTKASESATGFYNPHEAFSRLTRQGWKWMGRHFDPERKEQYELFVRQQNLPRYEQDLVEFYRRFQAGQPLSTISRPKKAGLKLKKQPNP